MCTYIFMCMGKVMHMPGISMEVRRSEDNFRGPHLSLCLKQGLDVAGFLTAILPLLGVL